MSKNRQAPRIFLADTIKMMSAITVTERNFRGRIEK